MNNEVQFKMSQILSETDYQLSHFAKGPLAYELQGAAIIWKLVVWYLLQKLIRYNLESSFDLYSQYGDKSFSNFSIVLI